MSSFVTEKDEGAQSALARPARQSIGRPRRLLRAVVQILHYAAGIALGALAVVVLLQVFSRYVIRSPIEWTIDGASILLIWVSMLGAATASFTGGHFALEFIVDSLPRRLARWVMVVSNLLVVVTLVELAYVGMQFTSLQMDQMYPSAELPKGWAALAIPVGAVLMIPRYLFDAIVGLGLVSASAEDHLWDR